MHSVTTTLRMWILKTTVLQGEYFKEIIIIVIRQSSNGGLLLDLYLRGAILTKRQPTSSIPLH